MMQPVKALAESVRADAQAGQRRTIRCWRWSRATSSWITTCLEAFGEFRDAMTEAVFLNTYGSPLLQALVGLGTQQTATPSASSATLSREAHEARLRAELERRFEVGGLEEAALRALIYIRLPEGSIDERGFAMLQAIRASRPAAEADEPRAVQGDVARSSILLVRLDEERAISAMPKLLADDARQRKAALDVLHRVLAARGDAAGGRQAPPGADRSAVRCASRRSRPRRRRHMPDAADSRAGGRTRNTSA